MSYNTLKRIVEAQRKLISDLFPHQNLELVTEFLQLSTRVRSDKGSNPYIATQSSSADQCIRTAFADPTPLRHSPNRSEAIRKAKNHLSNIDAAVMSLERLQSEDDQRQP